MQRFLSFKVETQHLGIELTQVERVIWAMEIHISPTAHPAIEGVINLHGQIIPVVNLRKLMEMEKKDLELEDQFVICKLETKVLALWVNQVEGVVSVSVENVTPAPSILPYAEFIQTIANLDHYLMYILNLSEIAILCDTSLQKQQDLWQR